MLLPRRPRAAIIALVAVLSAASTASADPQTAAPPPGCSGPANGTWLNVVASGLRSGSGQLAVTIYQDIPGKFLVHHGAIWVGRFNANSGTTSGCILVPSPGVYALALYHDENGNQKFDRTGIGLPAEGYGFSNNPGTFAGLPSFRSVRLSVPRSGLTTRVTMKYP
jgi:uncharacterized protein (DUF2141 family)